MVKFNDTFIRDVDTGAVDTEKVGYVNNVSGDTRFLTTGVKRIFLNNTKITVSVGLYTVVPQQPGKILVQESNNLLAYGDNLGFANPIIKTQGVIDLATYDSTTGLAPLQAYNDGGTETQAYIITLKLLQQIYKSGHVFRLYDYYDYNELTSTPTTPIYRVHTLDGIFPSETIQPINVMCSGLSYTASSSVQEGAKIDFNLEFKEVRV